MALENTLDNQVDDQNDLEIHKNIEENEPKKNKKSKLKFLIYALVIVVATGLALYLSLYQDFFGVINSIKKADWRWLLVIVALVFSAYGIEGFTIFVFSRLYTRKYRYTQGVSTALIGAFYSDITPGASGGQIMEAYTMKKQGVETSNAASIMVMSYIVYQICLIVLGLIGLVFSGGLIASVGTFDITIGDSVLHIPSVPLTIAGFLLNVLVIVGLFLMSFSHKFHNFIMHYGIGLLAKLRILKHPDKTRESLRVSVENFKIELRRLCSNIPIFCLMIICFSLILIIRFSIPFFAGLALNGFGYKVNIDGSLMIQTIYDTRGAVAGHSLVPTTGGADAYSFWQAVFLSSYHQMATGLIPIPGAAGVSEYFFNTIFANYYTSTQVTSAAQIIWRFSTYHVVLLVSGIFAATYHASPKEESHDANRKTFVTLQYQTFAERKASSDTMFETSSISFKEIQARLKIKPKTKVKPDVEEDANKDQPKHAAINVVKEEPKVTKSIQQEASKPKVEPIRFESVKPIEKVPTKPVNVTPLENEQPLVEEPILTFDIKRAKKNRSNEKKWEEIDVGED